MKEYSVDSALAQPLKPGIIAPQFLDLAWSRGTELQNLG
jgi:hypothetical protein